MEAEMKALVETVRETSFALHKYHRNGHLEKIYENGLAHRLRKQGHQVTQQFPIEVRDEDGTVLGDFIADLFVDDVLLVEVKACKRLADEHVAQLLGYLRGTGIEHGMLINFGAPRIEVRKFILTLD